MKLETKFYLAAVVLAVVGLVVGFVPLVGQACGSPFAGGGAAAGGTCELARSVLRGPALASLALGLIAGLFGATHLGFDDSKQ